MRTSDLRGRLPLTARLVLVAVPVMWLPLTLTHPFDITDVTTGGQDVRWLATHAAMLVLTPLVGILLLALLDGTPGTAATIGRIATIVWVAAFAAFEAIAGLTTGVLARLGEGAAAEALFDHGVVGGDFSVLALVAHPMWGVAVIAGAVALRADGAPTITWATLAVSSIFVIGHAGPLAFVAFAALAIAAWTGLAIQPAQQPPSLTAPAADHRANR